MMSKLKKILFAGTLAAALATPLHAQQKNTVTAHTETGVIADDLKFQRFHVNANTQYGTVGFTQDLSPDYNGKNPEDLLKVDINPKVNGLEVGSSFYWLGDYDKKQHVLGEAWASKSLSKDISAFLDVGASISTPDKNWKWAIANTQFKNAKLEAALFDDGNEVKKYARIGTGFVAKGEQNYFGVGHGAGENAAVAVIGPSKDIKNLTFALNKPEDGTLWVRSQTGIGSPNKSFYSMSQGETVLSYFLVDPFTPKKFGPLSTKGDFAHMLDWRSNSHTDEWNLTNMVSYNRLPVEVAVGANVHNTRTAIPVAQLYKNMKLGDFTVQGELTWGLPSSAAAPKRDVAAYIQVDWKR